MASIAAVGAVVHLLATAIEEGRDLSSMSGILADSSYRLLPADGLASLQVPGEEPVPGVPLELRDAGVPAHIGVQRLLLGAEGVEQVQGQLPVVSFVVPLHRTCSGMVTCRASSNRVPGTKLPLTREHVLDNVTLYWLTATGTSAARAYWETGTGAGPRRRSGPSPSARPGHLHHVSR